VKGARATVPLQRCSKHAAISIKTHFYTFRYFFFQAQVEEPRNSMKSSLSSDFRVTQKTESI